MWMQENDYDHNIRARVEIKAEQYLNSLNCRVFLNNVKDKECMDKVEIWEILVKLSGNEISLKEAHNQICSLSGVVGRSEQFTPKQLWKLAQKYNADDFIKIIKEIEG